MKSYWRSHLWDIVLCFAASTGLAFNVFAGYHSPDPRTESLAAIAAVVLTALLLLFLSGYNRTTTLAGIGAGIILIIVAVIAVRRTGVLEGAASIDDNPALFWLVTIFSAAACYLLSRSRIGAVLLILSGSIMSAAFCFLEYPVRLDAYLVFLTGAAALFLHRVYMTTLLQADQGKIRLHAYMLQSLVLVALAAVISGGLYAGVIRPLDPPTEELKLITRLQSFEIMEKLGISKKTEIQSQDNTTQELNDQTQTSNDQTFENESPLPQEAFEDNREDEVLQDLTTTPAQAISYFRSRPGWILLMIFVVLVLLILPFVLKYTLRRRWENRVRQAAPADQGRLLYETVIKKLRHAGFRRPQSVTLQEYVRNNADALAPFGTDQVDLLRLTERYQRVVYGCQPLDIEEANDFWTVYLGLRKKLRQTMGLGKYLLHYFAL